MERVLRGTPATLTAYFYNMETLVDPDDNDVTVTATRADGTDLFLTPQAATRVTAGVYAWTLPAQSNLNLFTVRWEGVIDAEPVSVTTYAEVVGGQYFTLPELRASDSALSNTDKYTTEKLRQARLAVEAEFEGICHRAFVPRYERELVAGDGTAYLWLDHPEPLRVITLSVDGEPWTDVEPRRPSDSLRQLYLPDRTWPNGAEVLIEYEYGMWTAPERIKGAALKRAKYRLVADSSRIDERATVMNVPDFGNFVLSTPGMRGAYTGIPEVDVVLDDYVLSGT